MIAFWHSPFERFMHIDPDTVWWGNVLDGLPWRDYDIIYNEPHEVITPFIQKSQYFDPQKLFAHVPCFPWQRQPYFNTGCFVARRGIFDLDEYLLLLDIQKKKPDILNCGEQGILNYMVFRKIAEHKISGRSWPLQAVVPVIADAELTRRFRFRNNEPVVSEFEKPRVIHWAGPKPTLLRSRSFSEPMTQYRMKYLRDIRSVRRYLGRFGLMYEDIQAILEASYNGSFWEYVRKKTSYIVKESFSNASLKRMLKRSSARWHAAIANGPRWLVMTYFNALSLFSRAIDNQTLSIRLRARTVGLRWPPIDFGRRRVILGTRTNVFLCPHLGEFDEEALFRRRISYEVACLRWLENHAGTDYDCIIEIGANVGLYSVFFEQLSRQPNARLKRIIAFEPAPEAYRRLCLNLAANGASRVSAFPLAIGDGSGFETFFEPQGSLTNGSFNKEFASQFSTEVRERTVLVFDATGLKNLFEKSKKLLLKIDVETYEPELLLRISDLIVKYRPDIIIGVLPQVCEAIETCRCLTDYNRFLIADEGLKKFSKLEAVERYRDWFLSPLTRL
jgi:FkbM family methyltransferase